ncbi:MAG TPA: hypothetical protein VGM83_18835 [Devosiaceae bacterium]|jgi:repressor LexA
MTQQDTTHPNRTHGLTPRQRRTLDFVTAYGAARQHAPSYREIADGIGLASVSGVSRLVQALEARGHLVRLPGKWRSLALVDPPGAPGQSRPADPPAWLSPDARFHDPHDLEDEDGAVTAAR